jgi:amidase/aspartyl-tRNA(Asn)/glutamyl-tRNA(Gln) amidotransferase subunit A
MRINKAGDLDEETVQERAAEYSFDLDEGTLEAFTREFEEQNEMLAALETFGDDEPPKRNYRWVDDAEDPLGAFITRTDISTDATGILDGIDIAVKDNIAVAGVPMTCGSKILESYHPRRDATVISRLLDAGATIAGKANMDEFAFGGNKSTMAYRLARNPRNPEHQPGGSSSGSAVAVANEQVDAALGSDTGGSVRFPAAWCGVVGVKPTRGLV